MILKYNLTELGCYKNLGTVDNYTNFIPVKIEYNNKTGDTYDLNNIDAYGNKSEDLVKKLNNNMETYNYSTQDIIDTKEARNNKTRTLVDNIKYKLDNSHIDYGKTIDQVENIDALPCWLKVKISSEKISLFLFSARLAALLERTQCRS